MESAKRPLCEGDTKAKATLGQCHQIYSAMGTCTKHDVSKRLCEAQKVSFFTVIITVITLLQNESQCFHYRTASNVECSQTEAVVGALPSTEEQCESHSDVCLCTQLTFMKIHCVLYNYCY